MWTFTCGVARGWWPFRLVERGFSYKYTTLSMTTGDTFVIVSTDDVGPHEVPVPQFMPIAGDDGCGRVPKRWHVCLRQGKLFWINDGELECAELVCDVV